MNKLDLKRVTLFCFDGREEDKERTARYYKILDYMLSRVEFHDVKMFCSFDLDFNGVKLTKMKSVSIGDYSHFCIKSLNSHISSDYCLIFQDDGFILNPDFWEDDFFNYDYIGAPWPLYIGWPKEGQQVGNGGFSLRSKKFLEVSSQMEGTTANEDTYILSKNRGMLEKNNIKIAPLEVARKFAIEFHLDKDHILENCFGFHGKSNLERALKYIDKKNEKN
jgi:hypothetical protein